MPGVIRRTRRITSPHPLLGFGGRQSIKSAVLLASSIIAGGTNEKQTVTITGTPTGGTFTLQLPGFPASAAIAFNAVATAIEDALELVLGNGNVRVTGGPLPGTAIVIEFTNDLGRRNVAMLTAVSSLTGGTTPAIAVTETTPGDITDAGRFIARRGLILMKGGIVANSKVIPWDGASATTVFGVMARDIELFDQTAVSDTDVPVYRGPGCDFNAVSLLVANPVVYQGGGVTNFATWAAGRGCTVGSQA